LWPKNVTSGYARPELLNMANGGTFGPLFKYDVTTLAWYAGIGKRIEKPEPVVMPPPLFAVHATSGWPASGPCVAPTASTYGLDAGKLGVKPHADAFSRAPKFATPCAKGAVCKRGYKKPKNNTIRVYQRTSSPDATKTVRPRKPILHTSVLNKYMFAASSSGDSEP